MQEARHRPGRGQRSRRCSEPPPPRLRAGIEQFNRGEFFEQHETLEEEWIAEPDPVRYLYQGILQVGVGFEHLRRGNPSGARALWRRGISYLEPFRGGCMNVDVDGQTLQDQTVTIRYRDDGRQERLPLTQVAAKLNESLRA